METRPFITAVCILILLTSSYAAAKDEKPHDWLKDAAQSYSSERSSSLAPGNNLTPEASARVATFDHLPDGRVVIIIPNSVAGEEKMNAVFARHVEIDKGATVVWINQDIMEHNVEGLTQDGEILFLSGHLATGDNFQYKFDESGEYQFVCPMHPWQKGTVKVR